MSEIAVKIVSQLKSIYEGNAYQVSLPTVDGQITIMPSHLSLIVMLKPGLVNIKPTQEHIFEETIFINRGLANITGDKIEVMADEAVLAKEISDAKIEEAMSNAKQGISSKLDPTELIQLEKEIKFDFFKRSMEGGN